jgi:hypothetical protein
MTTPCVLWGCENEATERMRIGLIDQEGDYAEPDYEVEICSDCATMLAGVEPPVQAQE